MKRYQTNAKCIEGFLDQSSYNGRTGTGSVYFEGKVLYSYGRHFPLAIDCGRYYTVNTSKYSQTTSRHQSLLRGQLSDMGKEWQPMDERK